MRGEEMSDKKRVQFIDMVKGLTVVSIAVSILISVLADKMKKKR